MNAFSTLQLLVISFSLQQFLVACQDEPECKPFYEIYASGKELCENMWGDAFLYETDQSNAYTMWFFDAENPNDEVSTRLNHTATDVCQVQYFHKQEISSESLNFTECHPWQSGSCCYYDTVKDVETINSGYGEYYRWDRCGALSQSCERFFVQEACFYECDINAGHYRRYEDGSTHNDSNTWELYKMPIKSDYCDAWFRACYNDFFCATDGGDFFSCARAYEAVDNAQSELEKENEELEGEVVALIVVVCVVGLLLIVAVGVVIFMRKKEKSGEPLFAEFNAQQAKNANGNETETNA